MSTFPYSQIIAADTEEEKVDQIGLAILRDEARKQGLRIVGETATRTHDEPVYSINTTGPNGEQGTRFITAAEAGDDPGRPVGRAVTWEIEVIPATPVASVPFTADKVGEGLARLDLPEEVAVNGGMIEIVHNLGGEVTAIALAADRKPVNYRLSSAITDDMVEIDLIPGLAASIEIRLDELPEAEADKDN